jgi:hypothetical protein
MKPDVSTAMTQLITEARAAIPFSAAEGLVCTGECGACVLKLIEHADAELEYWEHRLRQGAQPTLRELSDLAKVCDSAHKAVQQSGLRRSEKNDEPC